MLLLCYAMSFVQLISLALLTDLQQAVRDVTEQILVVNPDNSEALVSHIKVEFMPFGQSLISLLHVSSDSPHAVFSSAE